MSYARVLVVLPPAVRCEGAADLSYEAAGDELLREELVQEVELRERAALGFGESRRGIQHAFRNE